MPNDIPEECQALAEEVRIIEELVSGLQDSGEVNLSKLAGAVLVGRKRELQQCVMLASGWEPPPSPITIVFVGSITFRSDESRARGPFTTDFSGRLKFAADLTRAQIDWLEPIEFEDATITLSNAYYGPFDRVTGSMELPIRLHFDLHPWGSSDSNISLTFTTSTSGCGEFALNGSPLTVTRSMRVVAASRFDGGFPLDGNCGAFEADILLARHPSVPASTTRLIDPRLFG